MEYRKLHPWNVSIEEAAEIQRTLCRRVSLVDAFGELRRVAGADIGVRRGLNCGCAAVVVLSYPDFHRVEVRRAVRSLDMPYVPGYLSFRETPVLLDAFEQVENIPDVILIDGQGIAHPRGFGLASHVGLLLDVPTVGCAKSRLLGTFTEPPLEKGFATPLIDDEGRQIGSVVRTRTGVKPVFVSPGHKISFASAVDVALKCATRYRLPEPIRVAHRLTQEAHSMAGVQDQV